MTHRWIRHLLFVLLIISQYFIEISIFFIFSATWQLRGWFVLFFDNSKYSHVNISMNYCKKNDRDHFRQFNIVFSIGKEFHLIVHVSWIGSLTNNVSISAFMSFIVNFGVFYEWKIVFCALYQSLLLNEETFFFFLPKKQTSPAGFEPARDKPSRFLVYRLNHSAK